MKKIVKKFGSKLSIVAFAIVCAMTSIPVFAADGGGDISTVTNSVTSAIGDSKSEFITAIGAVVAVGVSWFLVKYVVIQVVAYFKRVAGK